LQYHSDRFGKIEYDEAEVIRFPQGLIGFADMHRFFLHHDKGIEPLCWLVSLDDPGLAFLIVNPFLFFNDYEDKVKLPKVLRSQMGEAADLRVLCIVTAAANFALSTVNLLGPLVINARIRNGWQVVLEDEELSTRHFLFPDAASAAGHGEALAV
jgi:flagellar assembly factor FliW